MIDIRVVENIKICVYFCQRCSKKIEFQLHLLGIFDKKVAAYHCPIHVNERRTNRAKSKERITTSNSFRIPNETCIRSLYKKERILFDRHQVSVDMHRGACTMYLVHFLHLKGGNDTQKCDSLLLMKRETAIKM